MDNSNNQANGIIHDLTAELTKGIANNAPANNPGTADGLPELDFLKDPNYANAGNSQENNNIPPEAPDTAPAVSEPVPEAPAAPETVPAAPAAAAPQNPALKYGRRMDYRTAKVAAGPESSTLNISAPTKVHNPLPTPKKRVPKELDFDVQPSMLEMHFDIVDMNGIDFFDIN